LSYQQELCKQIEPMKSVNFLVPLLCFLLASVKECQVKVKSKVSEKGIVSSRSIKFSPRSVKSEFYGGKELNLLHKTVERLSEIMVLIYFL